MPSTPPLVRPVLAALAVLAMLLAPALATSASAEPAGDGGVQMRLQSLTPVSLDQDGTLTAQVAVTNTSSEPIEDASLELRARSSRVTDRGELTQWESDSSPDTAGASLADSPEVPEIAPGDTIAMTVELEAEELGFSAEPYYWGTRRISLTLDAADGPLGSLRTFVVWRPDGAQQQITSSVLLPVTAEDPSEPATDPAAHSASITSGRLADLRTLAQRPDVDWWLDPSLLAPPAVPDAAQEAAASDGDAGEEGAAAAADAPDPAAEQLASDLVDASADRTVLTMPFAQAGLTALDDADAAGLRSSIEGVSEDVLSRAGVETAGTATSIAGEQASAQALDATREAGVDTVMLPSSSLRDDPQATVTPSSVGSYAEHVGEDGSPDPDDDVLAVLAPDPELSSLFSGLEDPAEGPMLTQRLLAETATIASEVDGAPRHLLISPDAGSELDAQAASAALDAMDAAPWLQQGRTSDLLDAASEGTMTTSAQSEGTDLYSLGEISAGQVFPSSADPDTGRYAHLDEVEPAPALTQRTVSQVRAAWGQRSGLAAVMEDDRALIGPTLMAASATSPRWTGAEQAAQSLADDAVASLAELSGRIDVVPASGYNLISDSAGVPITVTNDLDTPITVTIEVSSDRPLVRIDDAPQITVPANGEISTTVPVEAIANGTVTLTAQLTTPDGRQLGSPVDVPLTVNPAWENWTTLVLVIAMGALVVVGVARARRTGSATRAPADRTPEDPMVLATTGRSQPSTRPGESPATPARPPGEDDQDRPDDPDDQHPTAPEEDRP